MTNLKKHLLSLFLFILAPALSWADCIGPGLVFKNDFCYCEATGRKFDHNVEIDESDICRFAAEMKKLCQSDEGFLSYVFPDRCFCEKTRTYIFRPVATYFDGTRRAPFAPDVIDPPDAVQKAWDDLFETIKVTIASCIQNSRALVALEEKIAAQGSCSNPIAQAMSGLTSANQQTLSSLAQPILDRDIGAKTIKTDLGASRAGLHGGSIFTAKLRTGTTVWNDASDYPDIQGTPETALQAFGPVLGPFFGFQNKGSDIEMPDVAEMNGAIEKINRKILEKNAQSPSKALALSEQSPIPIRFFETPNGTTLPPRQYLKRIVQENNIPMGGLQAGKDQTLFFHDQNNHGPGFLQVPPVLYDFGIKQIQSLFEFEDFLKAKYPDLAKNPKIQYFFSKIYVARTVQLDSGSLVGTLPNIFKSSRSSINELNEDLQYYTRLLIGIIPRFHLTPSTVPYRINELTHNMLNSFEKYLPKPLRSDLQGAFQAFEQSKTKDSAFFATLDPSYVHELYGHFKKRQEFLEEIVREILK